MFFLLVYSNWSINLAADHSIVCRTARGAPRPCKNPSMRREGKKKSLRRSLSSTFSILVSLFLLSVVDRHHPRKHKSKVKRRFERVKHPHRIWLLFGVCYRGKLDNSSLSISCIARNQSDRKICISLFSDLLNWKTLTSFSRPFTLNGARNGKTFSSSPIAGSLASKYEENCFSVFYFCLLLSDATEIGK